MMFVDCIDHFPPAKFFTRTRTGQNGTMLSLGKSIGNGNFGGRYHYIGDSLRRG